jgi:hypothetical protein
VAITNGDIKRKFSVKTGSAGNSTAGTAAGSLGKYISTTEITSAALNNIFDTISGAENAASDVEYRCYFIHNNHGSLTWENVVVWMSGQTAGGADIAIGVDPTAASAIGSASAQAVEIANEGVAPAGVTFSTIAIDAASALTVGNIPPGQCKAIWLRRTATNSAAQALDTVSVTTRGDTAA